MARRRLGFATTAGKPLRSEYDFFAIAAFRFPHGDASAQRTLSLARAAAAAGYTPLVINDTAENAPADYVPGAVGSVDGIDFVCLPGATGGRASRLLHRVTRPLRILSVVRRAKCRERTPTVLSASGLCTLWLLIGLKAGAGATVVCDIVERHDASQFTRGALAPYFLRHRWTSFLASHLADGLIVISHSLRQRYSDRTPAPLVIPPLVDIDPLMQLPERPRNGAVQLVYVGNPRGKDQLGMVIDAIASLTPDERSRLQFTIAGADEKELASNPDVGPERLSRVHDCVTALGYVPRTHVHELLSGADFSVLIRPTRGYAAAGFPSKVPESLAAGCPVLTNLTSDLGEYLVDGANALICPPRPGSTEVSVETVAATIRRAVELSVGDRQYMRVQARATAERFSDLKWGPPLLNWLAGEH